MLGLGEEEGELFGVLEDLLTAGCSYLSLGQYLAPSRAHYPVQRFVEPELFELYKVKALEMGFVHVESAPSVRSSYHAELFGTGLGGGGGVTGAGG
jgi:lipoic acid synthetase